MLTINANTKIASILKQHPDALETIISISSKFTKLRNPVLRKVIASRTSIALASKLGGCSVDDFFKKLQPLGFEIDKNAGIIVDDETKNPLPAFMANIHNKSVMVLDVRPVIETGQDPLNVIMQNVNTLKTGSVLKIINSFEPTPLVHLLGKKGFKYYSEYVSDELVNTYFYKESDKPLSTGSQEADSSKSWDDILNRFNGKLETADVRNLKMPLPMHTILKALETLPEDKALFVYHKRIPVFLLSELEEQQFSYRIKEISDTDVHLLIYKD